MVGVMAISDYHLHIMTGSQSYLDAARLPHPPCIVPWTGCGQRYTIRESPCDGGIPELSCGMDKTGY